MKKLYCLVIGLVCVLIFQNFSEREKKNINSYPSIKIGEQIWMAKNLDVPTKESCCSQDCEKYGHLYNWKEAVKLANQIEGWRMPTIEDWRKLERHLGSPVTEDKMANRTGGDKLKQIEGFDIFAGRCYNGKIEYLDERASYWVLDTMRASGYLVALSKTLFNKGYDFKIDKIYHSYNSVDTKLSVRLIKE